MSDFVESVGKKRKADFALLDQEQRDTSRRRPESFYASEEELKKRRIVKVIRPANTDNNQHEEAPKGRFSFVNSADANETNDIKTTDSQKKINVTTSTIRFSQPEKKTENQITEKIDPIANNLSERKNQKSGEEQSIINKEEIKVPASLKDANTSNSNIGQVIAGEQGEAAKPVFYTGTFQKKFHYGTSTDNILVNTGNLQNKSTFLNISASSGFNTNNINLNPFLSRDTANNLTTSTNPFNTGNLTNRFASSSDNSILGTFKSTINFNMNNAPANPYWDSDDDDGDGVNPEEEVKISGHPGSSPQQVQVNPNFVKYLKINVQDLSEYNFESKIYQSKGKGDVSLELTRTANNTISAIFAFRNNALKILFQGNVLANVTNLNLNTKNYKYIIVIQKLYSINESTNKPEAKSVKLEFNSEGDFNTFKEKFKDVGDIIHKNDFSVFPVKKEEVISENAGETTVTSEQKKKEDEKINSEKKSKHK